MSAYRVLAWAIENRVPLVCTWKGQARAICPVILGRNGGKQVALAYQFGGESSGPLPAWRCFDVAHFRHVAAVDAPWQAGESHRQSQSCVAEVDYDANPASPYGPRHSLGRLAGTPFPG